MTKAQRHKHYKKALLQFNKRPKAICLILSDVCPSVPWEKILDVFTEFSEKNPNPKKLDRLDGWWPETKIGNEKRKNALKQCIKETSPKK